MGAPHILNAPAGAGIAGFTVERLLGAGGCGVVYRASRGGEVVALKLQPLEHLGGWAEREVSILVRLKHRNVVGFRGCGLYPARASRWFYLAMEYVPGRTLHQWVEEENPGARNAARLLLGTARGLEAAHAAGVLHRDVKEHNVVVREEDGEPVLLDFGVGDYPGAPCLASGLLPPGTPRYRSPEALAFCRSRGPGQGARYVSTPADDLYALGVVFYWVLTARYPFPGVETPAEVEAVIHQAPVAPHELNPRVPPALSGLCMRLLSKQPEARGSARALCEALEAALAGAGAGWDVPLCEAPPDSPRLRLVPPPGDGDGAVDARARRGGGGPPYRGRPPGRQEEPRSDAGLELPVLEIRARPVIPPGPVTRAEGLLRAAVALGLVVGVVTGLGVREWRPSSPAAPAPRPVMSRPLVTKAGTVATAETWMGIAPFGVPPSHPAPAPGAEDHGALTGPVLVTQGHTRR